jgi:hypothetical protein
MMKSAATMMSQMFGWAAALRDYALSGVAVGLYEIILHRSDVSADYADYTD